MKNLLLICAATLILLHSTMIEAKDEKGKGKRKRIKEKAASCKNSQVKEMKRKTPNLDKRFTDEQLNTIKKKENDWNEQKKKPQPEQVFTTKQAEYIHKNEKGKENRKKIKEKAASGINTLIKEMKRKTPNLGKRFTDKQLNMIKKKENDWNEQKKKPQPEQVFTTKQAEYIHKVRSCHGKYCFDSHGHEPKSVPTRHTTATSAGTYSTTATTGQPATTTCQPATTTGQPATTTGQPATTTRQPATTTRQPATTTGQPATTTGQPATTTRQPATTTGQPATTTGQPATTTRQPATTTGQPATTTGQPATTTRQPATTTGQPATTTRQPATTTGQPATTTGQPATTTGQPATTTGQPATTTRQPATTTRQPATTTGQPATTTRQPATTTSTSTGGSPPVVRRDYRTLTDSERNSFHYALNKLKSDKIDGVSKYDLLVKYHLPSVAPGAHFGCSFVPWHREYLKQMEVALRWEVSGVFIPYWDSTCDEGLPTPCDSIIWTDTFMGNNQGDVTSGPFSNWTTTQPVPGSTSLKINRNCSSSNGDLFEPQDIDYINSKNKFQDAFCYCDDATFETNHGLVHVFVGGDMSYIPISPNDPIFWLHHCFIDYLWEQWRLKKQTRQQRENDYPTNDVSCGPEYYASSPMKPFPGLINKDGLSNDYTDELYTYKDRPTCPSNCPGPYLFCNTNVNPSRCLTKIRIGGNCQGFNGLDVCYKGKCVNNKCVALVG